MNANNKEITVGSFVIFDKKFGFVRKIENGLYQIISIDKKVHSNIEQPKLFNYHFHHTLLENKFDEQILEFVLHHLKKDTLTTRLVKDMDIIELIDYMSNFIQYNQSKPLYVDYTIS